MSKTSDYWKMRELENRHRQQTLDFLDAYNKQIDDIYKYMLSTVQKEIDAFYGKYASDEGITMAEAKKRAAQLDIEAYARKAKRYVANKTFTKKANAEMKLYNLTMKVNRLELLKSNMGLELVNGFDDLEKLFGDTLTAEGVKEFRRQAGILGETIVKDDEDRYERLSDRMARASFHNATFSDRIWMHQDLLKGELNKALQQALISGASMERLARNIRNAFRVSTKNAQRLMRTEIRRMQTDVAMESYKRNGNEEYKYMALGRRPCEACRELDGNVYNVKKMEVGLNAPPMHPNCMCSTAPHVDEEAYQKWLDSFDNQRMAGAYLGAYTDENDPFGEERERIAEEQYEQIRRRDRWYEIEAVANNSGMNKEDVERVFAHVFERKHLFKNGTIKRFDADYYMFHSWKRLRDGKDIQLHDLIMLQHELAEEKIMGESLDIYYEEAHNIVNKKWNYKEALLKYLENNDA